MAGVAPPSSGSEIRDTLAAVLDDQAQRTQRRKITPKPKETGRVAKLLAVPLLALTLWMIFAPPAWLMPPPPPTPTPEARLNSLHMEIFTAAGQVFGFRERTGLWPTTLDEALAEPASADGLRYMVRPDGTFEIWGEWDGQTARYSSSQSLKLFVAEARAAIIAGTDPSG